MAHLESVDLATDPRYKEDRNGAAPMTRLYLSSAAPNWAGAPAHVPLGGNLLTG